MSTQYESIVILDWHPSFTLNLIQHHHTGNLQKQGPQFLLIICHVYMHQQSVKDCWNLDNKQIQLRNI